MGTTLKSAGCVDSDLMSRGTLISFGMDVARSAAAARRVVDGGALDGHDLVSLWSVVAALRAGARDQERYVAGDYSGPPSSQQRVRIEVVWAFVSHEGKEITEPTEIIAALDGFAGELAALAVAPTKERAEVLVVKLRELSSYILRSTGSSGETVIFL